MDQSKLVGLRSSHNALEAALLAAGAIIRGSKVRCPFHDDNVPSASIYKDESGCQRFHCFTCEIDEDVIGVKARHQGKSSGDVLSEMSKAEKEAEEAQEKSAAKAAPPRVFKSLSEMVKSVASYSPVEGVWQYGLDGAVSMIVIRRGDGGGGKTFVQARPAEGGGFVMQAPAKPWPIYNQTRLRDNPNDFVIVVEGEKCVHALHELGYLATTSPGGASNAKNADWKLAGGKRTVYLWPDADPPNPLKLANGRAHPKPGVRTGFTFIADVEAMLLALPDPPRILRVDVDKLNLPPKGDVVEFIEAHPDDPSGAIAAVLAQADPAGPAAKVGRLIDDTITGKRAAVEFPWRVLSEMTQALLPGTITVLCGDGGSTKTFFVLEAAAYWQNQGVPWAMQELEEDEEGSTLLRVLAQREGNGDLTQSQWLRENPDAAKSTHSRHADYLDAFGRSLWAIPGNMPSLDELKQWVRERCAEGKRVLIIDPITAADSDDKPWIADKKFVRETQTILREARASLILVTHPKQGRKSAVPTMDDVAGGSAYQRFVQNVMWLQRIKAEEPVECRAYSNYSGWRTDSVNANRKMIVFKARNGRWSAFELALSFGPDLCFMEHGIIFKKSDGGPPQLPDLQGKPKASASSTTLLKDAFD